MYRLAAGLIDGSAGLRGVEVEHLEVGERAGQFLLMGLTRWLSRVTVRRAKRSSRRRQEALTTWSPALSESGWLRTTRVPCSMTSAVMRSALRPPGRLSRRDLPSSAAPPPPPPRHLGRGGRVPKTVRGGLTA